jgi:hypothetical protein
VSQLTNVGFGFGPMPSAVDSATFTSAWAVRSPRLVPGLRTSRPHAGAALLGSSPRRAGCRTPPRRAAVAGDLERPRGIAPQAFPSASPPRAPSSRFCGGLRVGLQLRSIANVGACSLGAGPDRLGAPRPPRRSRWRSLGAIAPASGAVRLLELLVRPP